MTIPETIYAWRYDDKTNQGRWTKALNPNVEASFIRADIADARVAAAYEAAAELACERLADSWSWDDEDFLSCVIADLKRHVIESVPTQEAKVALDEIERLRVALEDVAGVGFDAPMTWAGTDAEWERRRANAMQHAARAALKGGDQ